MSDRSEVTESREPRSTDDILAETEELLSESGGATDRSAEPTPEREPDEPAEAEDGSWWGSDDSTAEDASSDTGSDSSRFAGLIPSGSLGELFSPKAFLALAGAIGAGLFAADMVLPIGGRIVGMLSVAFVIGLVTSKRRYLEMATAGLAVGSVAALLNHAILAAAGSGQTILAIGAVLGLLSSVVGYYFGRDLRDGLARDIE